MTRPYLLAGYAMPPIKRFVRSKRSVRITMTSTGYPMSPTAPRIATRLSWVFAGAGSTTNRSMSLSLVICPVAADPNRMILSGRATVRTRRTTSFSSVSSTFIQFHHTQSCPQLHERSLAGMLDEAQALRAHGADVAISHFEPHAPPGDHRQNRWPRIRAAPRHRLRRRPVRGDGYRGGTAPQPRGGPARDLAGFEEMDPEPVLPPKPAVAVIAT